MRNHLAVLLIAPTRPRPRGYLTSFLLLSFLIVGSACPAIADEPLDPVVFIPGILGSKLEDDHGVVWGDFLGTLKRFADLELQVEPNKNKLRATAVLDTISVFGPFQLGQYSGLLRTLVDLGYKDGQNLFLFPYDWRQSNFDAATKLRDFIDSRKELVGRKFNIVAHSMGGLVARIYIQNLGGGKRVNRLVTLGTPYLGSAEALWTFFNGLGRLTNFVVGGSDLVKRVVFSFASMYELLPGYKGCCVLGAPDAPDRTLIDIRDLRYWQEFGWVPAEFRTPARWKLIAAALEEATEIQRLATLPLPDGVRLFKIAGDLINTTSRVYLDKDTGATLRWDQFGGDGTVPEVSATADDWVDAAAATQVHATIFNDDHVKIQLKRILTASTNLEKFAFTGTTARVKAGPDDDLIPLNRVEFVKEDNYSEVGQRVSIRVRVLNEQNVGIPDVKIQVWLYDTANSRRELQVVEESSGDYAASFNTPLDAGVYRLNVNIPGVGLFEDYFAALPDTHRR